MTSEHPSNPTSHEDSPRETKRGSEIQSALDLWATEGSSTTPTDVSTIRIDNNERLMIPFTPSLVRCEVHYLEAEGFRGYIRCNGSKCLLCEIGRARDTRDLVPVYDIHEQAVGVLPVSTNVRPNALRPQLFPVVQRVAAGEEPFLLTVRKSGFNHFVVSTTPLPQGADDGASCIADFQARIEDGLDLASVYEQHSNEYLAEIPEVQKPMMMKGIVL